MTDKQLISKLKKLLNADSNQAIEAAVSALAGQAQPPPLILTVAIDRRNGRLSHMSTAQNDADLAALQEAQHLIGGRIVNERLALVRRQQEPDGNLQPQD